MPRILACLLLVLWLLPAGAQLSVIQHMDIEGPEGWHRNVPLPHFLEHAQSGLAVSRWQLHLPDSIHSAEVPALLIAQIVQGSSIKLNGHTIYELPPSDSENLRNWYQPALIPLPRQLLDERGANQLSIEQTGHLRGWFISPMLAGDLKALNPRFWLFNYLSQTLSITVNLLSGLAGALILVHGLRTRSQPLKYSGLASILWSTLFPLAVMPVLPQALWPIWRLALYLAIGLLIYFLQASTALALNAGVHRRQSQCLLTLGQLGWIAFLLGGAQVEPLLDVYWMGAMVVVFSICFVQLMAQAWRQGQRQQVLAFMGFGVMASMLVVHDYSLQSGVLPLRLPNAFINENTFGLLAPIYLTHLSLPAFIVLSWWLHLRRHTTALQNQNQLQAHPDEQREQIIQDLHDGVGSRLNLLIWELRHHQPPSTRDLEGALHQCMDELRFAIHPGSASMPTLSITLRQLCARLQSRPAPDAERTSIQFEESGTPCAHVSSNTGLHLYKMAEECISNALRHSAAQNLRVRLHQTPTHIELTITDDGSGIPDWDNLAQNRGADSPHQLGLSGLKKRVGWLHGKLHIQSDGHGTRVHIEVADASKQAHGPA